jgi:hypothetical protein
MHPMIVAIPALMAIVMLAIIKLTINANNAMINDCIAWDWPEIERMAKQDNYRLIHAAKIIIILTAIVYACILIL